MSKNYFSDPFEVKIARFLGNTFLKDIYGLTDLHYKLLKVNLSISLEYSTLLSACIEFNNYKPVLEYYEIFNRIRYPYREWDHFQHYFNNFEDADFEIRFLKAEFWSSLLQMNLAHKYVITLTFWFFRVETRFLCNNLLNFTIIDYLQIVWAKANVLRQFNKTSQLNKLHSVYLPVFTQEITWPDPLGLPTYGLIRVINEGFAFGLKANLLHSIRYYHLHYMENLRRLQSELTALPFGICESAEKLSIGRDVVEVRERKKEVEYLKNVRRHQQWKWRERHLQLILIEQYDSRIQQLWSRFHTKLTFYLR